MKVFDGRHRWGPIERKGSTITRTCRVCGLVNSAETLVPDFFIDTMIATIRKPSIYRTLIR